MRNMMHRLKKSPWTTRQRNALWIVSCILLFSLAPRAFSAISYPYALPNQLNATLKVDTGSKTHFNNLLLGLNTNFPENQYGSDGYNDPDGQDLITTWNPPALRFPHGVWANFYDWEVDGRRIYDGYDGTYVGAVTNVPHLRYGFPGFNTLHNNLNFDVLFTWNVNYDSPAKGVARLQDRVAKGFDVKYIELGNEHFWKDQCSEAVDTAPEYIAVAQAHSAALKAEDPSIQISVPVSWRTTGYHATYNNALMADMSYYDAVSLHKYLRTDGNSATEVKEALKSRYTMIETGEYIRSLFPGKPIWLSEWSVKVDADGNNAVSVLGMTEVYLGMLNRPDLFETADYFQIHNHDPMVLYDKNANPKHVKTSIGAAYDIIRYVFEDSEVYDSSINSSGIEENLDAVSAEAVINGGDVLVFAVNKTTNSVPLGLIFDDELYTGKFSHGALSFSDINDFPTFNLGDDALVSVSPVNGGIMLPPLSISKISGLAPGSGAVSGEVIIEAEQAQFQSAFSPYTVSSELDGTTYIVTSNGTPTINYNSVVMASGGIASYAFNLSATGDVLIEARADLIDSNADSFWHRLDGGTWIKQDGFSGGGWRWFTLNSYTNLAPGSHTLEIARRDRARIDQFRLSSTHAEISVPGLVIEAEEADGQLLFSPFAAVTSNGATYVEVPLASGSANYNSVAEPDGRATYDFFLINPADIVLEARVDFPTSGSDSFWHRMDGGSWTKQDGISGGGWRWLTLANYANLDAGAHQLEIARRQAGARMDAFRLVPSAGGFLSPETIADAGGNRSVVDADFDGVEWIALDGSGSVPQGGLSLTSYVWKRGSGQIATGIRTNVALPLGTHLITLQVTDSGGATRSDTVTIAVEPAVGSGDAPLVLAGWDTWNNASAPSASVLAPDVGGTAVTTAEQLAWNVVDERGASADGDWGTFAGPPTASTITNVDNQNMELPNAATGGAITFTISNNGASDLELGAFHFDAYAFRPKAARAYELSVLAGGGITPGVIYTSADDEITDVGGAWDNFAHDDIDHSLAGLTDHTLGAGESVDFLLAFSSGAGDGSGGHDLWVDNVAISSMRVDPYPDNDGNGLPDWWEIFFLGSTGQVAGVDSDGDGLSNGDELIAGSDPDDAYSALVIHEFEEAIGGGYTVKWDSYSERTYHVLKTSNLVSNAWPSVSGPLPGTGGEMAFTDASPVSPSNSFYKIEVAKP
ncbi:hypothetical protein [Pontiella desulfatans]|nr:hypothetical protein [Pontiella desulfatans]